MFWREKERKEGDRIGPLFGQIRVLVVGDSGVGKTSLVSLICKGSAIARPSQTVGCAVSVKHTTYGSPASSTNSIKGDSERDFFVELWDMSGHERYKDCRSLFYNQINGVIFVHDLSQRKTKTNLQKWAAEISATGSFSAPLGSPGFGGLPVPYLVLGNKADVAAKDGTRGSSGNLVDVARQWVEKQGLLPPTEELPLTDSFSGSTGLVAAAKEARFDKEAITRFFRTLIRRRYFSEELPVQNPWGTSPLNGLVYHSSEISSDYKFNKNLSLHDGIYQYDAYAPLPAQHNLPPPPTLYPQQPMSVSDNYGYQRVPMPEIKIGGPKASRADLNV